MKKTKTEKKKTKARGRNKKESSQISDLVGDLVHQFSNPLDFFRELIQNSIDAGSNRIEVTLEYALGAKIPRGEGAPVPEGGAAVIRVRDDGEGMNEDVIDNYLLVLFSSTKENDFTKIGKFGIGFVSVFAPKPDLVRVYTGKDGESWRLDFPGYKRYEKFRLPAAREGTVVEVVKRMTSEEFEKLIPAARDTVRYWCKHSEAGIFFRAGDQKGPFEELSEPFGIRAAGGDIRYKEEGTELALAFTSDPQPFFGFYNRGLTLKEGQKDFYPGIQFKAKSRYLEHTLTRDNVFEDDNYRKLQGKLKTVVEDALPARLRTDLEEAAARLSSPSPGAKAVPLPPEEREKLLQVWADRLVFLRGLFTGRLARWRRSDWPIFPTVNAGPASLAHIQDALDRSQDRLYFDSGPNKVTGLLAEKGIPVLAEGPWTAELLAWTKASPAKASDTFIAPEVLPDSSLPPADLAFLESLRAMDARVASRYREIFAARLDYPGSCAASSLFVCQLQPGTLSPPSERAAGSLLFGKVRLSALLNTAHGKFRSLARLHERRPGLAAYLALKVLHLHDGEVPAEKRTRFFNLAEDLDAALLADALALEGR